MAVTVSTQISQLYVALFGRAPDASGLAYWEDQGTSGTSISTIANHMFAVEAARDYYAADASNAEIVTSFYVNVLGRTPDADGLTYWTGELTAALLDGGTVGDVITQLIAAVTAYVDQNDSTSENTAALKSQLLFANKTEVADYYADNIGTVAGATTALANVTDSAASVTAAKTSIDANIPATFTLAASAAEINEGAANTFTVTASKAVTVATEVTFQLAVDTAQLADFGAGSFNAVTVTIPVGGTTASYAYTAISNDGTELTETYSVSATIGGAVVGTSDVTILDGTVESGQTQTQTQTLTAGQDTLNGSNTADTFKANVVQSEYSGAQVNSLGSGDALNGNGGVDTLNATITAGVFAGGSYSMPIQPETTSIEIIKLEAVSADISNAANTANYADNNTQVYVNAKDMVGVEQLWSSHSDADLVIQNLTTQGLSKLSDMTIGMEYTGNADSRWDASDMTVYFDQDYLTPEATNTNPTIDILAMNEDAYDETDGALALAGVFFRELTVTVNGERFDLTQYMGENADGKGEEISTYADLLAAIQAALVELKADNAGNAALQSLTASFGGSFFTDVDPVTLIQREGTTIRLTIEGLTGGEPNTLSVASTDLEVARAATAAYDNNNRYERADNDPATAGDRLAINVDLEKVGLTGDGGNLIIGSMNKTEANVWDAVNTVTDTTSGIEEFNVTVHGANDKSSSLAGLHSTNNNLRVVTVKTDAALTGTSFADLTIGNSNTTGFSLSEVTPSLNNANALKDVQTFDASAFKGDLFLHAALTEEVTAKYLDLKDEAPAASAADNVAFEYTGGTGNDNFNIALSSANLVPSANLAALGTTTREDLTLNIDGGAGNDVITLAIVDEDSLAQGNGTTNTFTNWYDNNVLNANLSINGGEGDDTIWTPGSGDIIIKAGDGNDTVYADNTGDKAVWAFNVADSNLTDPTANAADYAVKHELINLQSDTNESYQLFNATLTVTYLGFEVDVTLPSNNGIATDAEINQAIKLAINKEGSVLSKLLVATDGPANTLVVTSLIDDTMVAGDLTIGIKGPTTVSAGDIAQLASWYNLPGSTLATLQAVFTAQIAKFEVASDYATDDFAMNGTDIVGDNSAHVSDNTITGGLGNDVLVLGTGVNSNDTVVYTGFGNGTDSIVNFDTGNHTVTTQTVVDTGRVESFTITFADITASAGETLTFNADVIALNDGVAGLVPAEDVALAFYEQYAGDWTVAYTPGATSLTLSNNAAAATPDTNNVVGNVATNVVTADFNFSTAANDASVVISNYVEGLEAEAFNAAATFATFNLDFDVNGVGTDVVATASGALTYFGASIDYVAGDGAITLAAAFAAESYADWNAVLGTDGTTVTYTAKVAGTVATPDAVGVIAEAAAGVDPIVIISASGLAAVTSGGTYTTTTVTSGNTFGIDDLDFSSYNAESVLVDGVLIAGIVATAGQDYVVLTESTTNDGSYTAQVFTEAGATDTLVGLVGVLDFGVEQDFVAANFIL